MSPNNTAGNCRIGEDTSDGSVHTRIRESSVTGEIDESLVEILAWILETDTRARIYLFLRQQPGVSSEAIATGTGLYPSTVRETLSVLVEEGTVLRAEQRIGDDGAMYVYEAIPPERLVVDAVETVQDRLNTVFQLDELLGVDEDSTAGSSRSEPPDGADGVSKTPVSVTVSADERVEDP